MKKVLWLIHFKLVEQTRKPERVTIPPSMALNVNLTLNVNCNSLHIE
jgi:hypothetical protein